MGKKSIFTSTSHIYNNPGGFQKKASETIQRRTSLGPRVALVYLVHLFLVTQHKVGSKTYCILDTGLGSRETRAEKTPFLPSKSTQFSWGKRQGTTPKCDEGHRGVCVCGGHRGGGAQFSLAWEERGLSGVGDGI